MEGIELDPIYVYVRDMLSRQWTHFTPAEWADTYRARILSVVGQHRVSMGGELTWIGSSECGRITLVHGNGDTVLMDFDWYTLNLRQAMGLEPNGIPALPQPQ